MRKINRVVALTLTVVVFGCAARLARMTDAEKAERLAVERGRLSQVSDPMAKIRSYITISNILVDFASGMAHDGNTVEMAGLIAEYATTIQDARDVLVKSGLRPDKQPAGFKDLEQALRLQALRLQDLGERLSPEDREPVSAAAQSAGKVREELTHLLNSAKR